MTKFEIAGQQPYLIQDIQHIVTPRLLVFRDRVERNLARMQSDLESIAPNSGFRHLCVHTKTNKSSLITKLMLDIGINSFKCCLNEMDMVAQTGATDIFIAYPLLLKNAFHIIQLMFQFPETHFHVQIGSMEHAQILHSITKNHNVLWRYFIDLDVGMHRTGIAPQEAFSLYSQIAEWDNFQFSGLHGYDGHIHDKDVQLRNEKAQLAMQLLCDVYTLFQKHNVFVPRIVVAGSPAFQQDFAILHDKINTDTLVQVSPGTFIYWDSCYENILPQKFEYAALILAQVIDKGSDHRITLNLGHKRWAADQGPVEVFSNTDLRKLSFSEEHTVLQHLADQKYKIGDYVLIVPRHICPTVNLYEEFTLIDEAGEIEQLSCPIEARNR